MMFQQKSLFGKFFEKKSKDNDQPSQEDIAALEAQIDALASRLDNANHPETHRKTAEGLPSSEPGPFKPGAFKNYPLRYAAKQGYLNVIKHLLSCNGVDPTANDNYAIRLASKYGHLDVVKCLLTCDGIDTAADDNYAIRWASAWGHLDVVETLLTCDDVDPAADNNYAIRWASSHGHLDVVKCLLTCDGVDPAAKDNYAIRWASLYEHLDVVKCLLTCDGVLPNNTLSYPGAIQRFAADLDLDITLLLNAKHRRIQQTGFYTFMLSTLDSTISLPPPVQRDTPHLPECSDIISNPLIRRSLQKTPPLREEDLLILKTHTDALAVHLGDISPELHTETRGDLQPSDSNTKPFSFTPNASDNFPLIYAAKQGYQAVVKYLLRCNDVDASAQDHSALREAAHHGHLDIVKTLLTCDSVNPANANNDALRLATQAQHAQVVSVLLQDNRVLPDDTLASEDTLQQFAADFEIDTNLLRNEKIRRSQSMTLSDVIMLDTRDLTLFQPNPSQEHRSSSDETRFSREDIADSTQTHASPSLYLPPELRALIAHYALWEVPPPNQHSSNYSSDKNTGVMDVEPPRPGFTPSFVLGNTPGQPPPRDSSRQSPQRLPSSISALSQQLFS